MSNRQKSKIGLALNPEMHSISTDFAMMDLIIISINMCTLYMITLISRVGYVNVS